MSELRIQFLGTPRFERDGKVVKFERRKSIVLLAYLALTGQPQGRDTLATLLWPDQEQKSARTILRQVLVDIRRKLGEDYLDINRENAVIRPNHPAWIDVLDFRERINRIHTHKHAASEVCEECAALLATAVDLYHADFLVGFTIADSEEFDEWQSFQTEQLRLELISALDRLVQFHIEQGSFDAGLGYARRWISLNPLDERPHRYLIRLYSLHGQKMAAIKQFNTYREIIAAAGLTLDIETMQMVEQIRA